MYLLLDVDGVLQFERQDLASKLIADFGWEGDHGAFREMIFSDLQFGDALRGKCDFLDVLKRLTEGARIEPLQYLKSWVSDFVLNHDLLETLQELQCGGVYLASNQEKWRGTEVAKAYEQYSFITAKYFSHEMGFRKPETGFFRHIIHDLGVPANELIFVDDLAENVEAAEKLGMRTVRFESNRHLCHALRGFGCL